jgi:S1-C subfamily serine protease
MKDEKLFDAYLESTLAAEERTAFEERLEQDEAFRLAFEQHCDLLSDLVLLQKRLVIKEQVKASRMRVMPAKTEARTVFYLRTASVAAATAFVAVMSTILILSKGGYLLTSRSNQITELNRKVGELRASNEGIVEGITRSKKRTYAPANLEASAFALNNQGYILTSYHAVKSADSIYVRNSLLEPTAAEVVYTDATIDLAILKLKNDSVITTWRVPYGVRSTAPEIGEKVFTLGYPRNDMVYGEGSLSSLSGYGNDTAMYQISIPVNPGNSGGPLLDEYGQVIGVIRGKESSAEGTGFAVKMVNILSSVEKNGNDTLKLDLLKGSPKKSQIRQIRRPDQIKKINPYVFNVLVYKKD